MSILPKSWFVRTLLGLGLATGLTPAQGKAGIVYTVEAPGVQAPAGTKVVETFNSIATGSYTNLVTNVGTLTATSPGAVIIVDNVYGGADGVGNYLAVGAQSGQLEATLTFDTPQTYFGMWWSAVDAGNHLEIKSGGTTLLTLDGSTLFSLNPAYFGNPNPPGGNSGEPYVYLNFFATAGDTFDSVLFRNDSTGTGFEMDNFAISAVPEPSSLAMVAIAGLAGAGALYRRTRNRRSPVEV